MDIDIGSLAEQGWERIGSFADFHILADGDERALYCPIEDSIILKYSQLGQTSERR